MAKKENKKDPEGLTVQVLEENVQPGHAVISTFDLFSIGGKHYIAVLHVQETSSVACASRSQQLPYGGSHASGKDLHSRSAGVRPVGSSELSSQWLYALILKA